MRITAIILGLVALSLSSSFGQNYFTGELFEAYEWDLKTINDIDLKLESDIILRRRLLSKKEKTIGDRVKENKQFYDEVIIKRYNKIEVVRLKDNHLEIKFPKRSDFTLLFAPDDRDNENYVVLVKQMKGDKGVAEYSGMTFRVLNGSRLTLGKLKKKKLPPRREQNLSSQWKGNGTGVLIDNSGYLLTNYHVIDNANDIVVVSPASNGKDLAAKVIMKDESNDLAILKITDKSYITSEREIPFSLVEGIQDVGSEVFTLGYPMALSNMGSEVKYTEGSISSKTGYQDDVSMYQISVPIQPGNSGGPLFDKEGNLVGIVNAKIVGKGIDNVSYAIKASYAKTLLESSSENITTPAGAIGGSIEFLIKQLDDYVYMIKVD